MSNEAASLVDKKATLIEMWDVCAAVSFEIEVGQGAMVLAGLRTEPDPERMRRAHVLVNVCRLIEVVREVEPEFRALVARKRGWTDSRRARA